MTRTKAIKILKSLYSCQDSIDWVRNKRGTPQQLWDKCNRADWMLWLVANQVVPGTSNHKKLVRCCYQITKLDLKKRYSASEKDLYLLILIKKWLQEKTTKEEIDSLRRSKHVSVRQSVHHTACIILNPDKYVASAVVSSSIFELDDVVLTKIVRKYFPDCPIFETAD